LQKKNLKESETYGLTADQIKEAEKYLKKNKLSSILNKQEAAPLYEMFILGYSFEDIHSNFKNIPVARIILTAAVYGWVKDRETLANSIYDRVKTRMIKSTVEQVEFLTDLIAISTKENTEAIKKYLQDPVNNKPPEMRIESLKDYKQVVEMLASIANSMKSSAAKANAEVKVITNKKQQTKQIKEQDEGSALLAELAEG
jgi:hypothetical protein